MNRIQFIALTSLSGVIAFCLLLQVIFSRMSASDGDRLRTLEAKLQDGQLCVTHWKQMVTWTGQLAQQQNDQALKDLLGRQGLQIKQPQGTNAPAAAPAATPSTR
jgi:hypothetical protein